MRHELAWWAHALVAALIGIALLVALPLGLRLIDAPALRRLRGAWQVAAVPAAVSVWLPRGWFPAALAAGYLVATAVLLAFGVRLLAREWRRPPEVAMATAMPAPAVGACALVAERAGHRLFGFDLDVLALTVAHFHYAGFAGALVAALVCRLATASRAARAAALSVPAGTAVVFVGFFVGDWLELAGSTVLTAGMWLVGWLTWRHARPAGPDRAVGVVRGLGWFRAWARWMWLVWSAVASGRLRPQWVAA